MAAPATAERTRAAAGTIPGTLKEAAPDVPKDVALEEAEAVVPEAAAEDTTEEPDETGLVAVAEAVETLADELQ